MPDYNLYNGTEELERPVDRVVFWRCPKCLGHLTEIDDTDFHCPNCAIHCRITKVNR